MTEEWLERAALVMRESSLGLVKVTDRALLINSAVEGRGGGRLCWFLFWWANYGGGERWSVGNIVGR